MDRRVLEVTTRKCVESLATDYVWARLAEKGKLVPWMWKEGTDKGRRLEDARYWERLGPGNGHDKDGWAQGGMSGDGLSNR